MVALPALALTVLLSSTQLDGARQAFAAKDYDRAEALARDAAAPPERGAALYLAGLAAFRAGRFEGALQALDEAGLAEDPPERTTWQYNRAACLFELSRFAEAEAAYREAAENPELSASALVNAGFAALSDGSVDRAEKLRDEARAVASAPVLLLVEDLALAIEQLKRELEHVDAGESGEEVTVVLAPKPKEPYDLAMEKFDAEAYGEARAGFLEAAAADPSGRSLLMAGASAFRGGHALEARGLFLDALDRPLEPADREVAFEYLDRVSAGLGRYGEGWGVFGAAGGGFDSNVFQLGVSQRANSTTTAADQGSAFGQAFLSGSLRERLSARVFADATYAGGQRAYLSSTAEDYSLQHHRLSGRLDYSPLPHFRLGASATGELVFTGLSAFRGMQGAALASGWVAYDVSDSSTSRLEGAYARKVGLATEFDYLSGNRWEATVAQELRLSFASGMAWLRYRSDGLGTLTQSSALSFAPVLCPGGGCTFTDVIPLSWRGPGAGLTANVRLFPELLATLEASAEHRTYPSQSVLRVTSSAGAVTDVNPRLREDTRLFLAPSLTATLFDRLELELRYELLVNRSNVDTGLRDEAGACSSPEFSCHRLDFANENFEQHLVSVEAGWSF